MRKTVSKAGWLAGWLALFPRGEMERRNIFRLGPEPEPEISSSMGGKSVSSREDRQALGKASKVGFGRKTTGERVLR